MQENNQLQQINFNDESINLRQELEKYAYYWKWFVVAVIISVTTAFMFLRYATNQYEVATTILINDEETGGLASELSAFQDLGLMGGSNTSSIENEIELLKSRTLIERVVKDLGVNVTYYNLGRVKVTEAFQSEIPLKINFFAKDSVFYKKDTTFTIRFVNDTEFALFTAVEKEKGTYSLGETIASNFGEFMVTPLLGNTKIKEGYELLVKLNPLDKTIDLYQKSIQIQPVNKNASVLKLSLTSNVKVKAQAILDNLVLQYNKDAVEDKSLVAKNTNKFINQRLEIISKDLSNVDKGVEIFKTKNKLTDIPSEASLILDSSSDIEKKIVELNTQLRLVDYVSNYMVENTANLIPANLGLPDAAVSESTSKYNELILERNRILKSSSNINPVIINLNAQIESVRNSIAQSLVNLKSSLTISLNDVKKQETKLNAKITAVPRQEREYRDIQRQQQIIEALYLYLLEKREENAITLAVTQPNAKIIDKAYGSNIPVAPKRKIIYLASLLLGLIIPFGFIYVKFLLDNKVHTRKDIEPLVKAPILGDIPASKQIDKIVISDQDRSSVAEAFRLLRTNINFMFAKVKGNSKSIFLTSTLSGEGKTFIAINLASVLAVSKKKVLLIGADIRKPKILEYIKSSSGKGLTHYLMDHNVSVSDVIEPVADYGFDMVHSGVIPPNPSELLMTNRFNDLLTYGKEHYDFVIVDNSPVNLVTDTLLIADYADLFIYVIRANFLDKRLLEVPKLMYDEKRLPNMAVLINDTNTDKGYGYGYGYGYGEQVVKKKWWQVFSK